MLKQEEQIFKQIEKASNILIVFSSDWEADSVCASLGLYLFLKKSDKNVTLAASNNKEKRKSFTFLPGSANIKNNLSHLRRFIVSLDISKTKVSQIKYVVEKNQLNFIVSPEDGWFESSDVSSRAGSFYYDLIICVGANDLESLGEIYDKNIEFFYKTPIINFSCKAANEEFGQINCVDINNSSVSELIFNFLKLKNKTIIDENIATNLLAGIILQTKNFKTGNLSPETLINTSNLIKLGGRREEIVKQLYSNRRIYDLKIWGKILQNLKVRKNILAWSVIDESELENSKLNLDSFKDLIEELMSGLSEIEIVLIIVNRKESKELIALSLKNYSAVKFLKSFSPQGGAKLASANSSLQVDNIMENLLP